MNKFIGLICISAIIGWLIFPSDSDSNIETKRSITTENRLSIDELKNISTEELNRQILDFINQHPDRRDKLIDYIFNVQLVNNHFIKENTASNISSDSRLTNSIPLIGGMLTDKTYEDLVQKYSDNLVAAVTDYSLIKKTTRACVDNGIVTERVHDMYLAGEIGDENDVEIYNTKLKIAELNRRFFESFVEIHKSDESIQDLLSPLTPIDFVVGAFSLILFENDNDQTMKSASDSLHNTCENLWIDMQRYKDEESIAEYYFARIPKYLFAYDIEETYFPRDLNEVYVSIHSGTIPNDALKKLYSIFSGKWKSLKTGEIIEIADNYINESKVMTYPKFNMVHMMSKTAPYAECDYRGAGIGRAGNIAEIFLTPVRLPDENGIKKDVLLMYANYKMVEMKGLRDDRWRDDWEYVQNYRVFNIQTADDIFVKMDS